MKKEDDRKQLLAYMKNKYSEEFIYKEAYAGQLGAEYTAIVVESHKYPGQKILVRVSQIDGQKCYEDNYPAYLLKEEIEREMESIAGEYFGSCSVTYQIPMFVFPENFGADTTVDGFLSAKEVNAEILLIPEEQYDRATCEEKLDGFRKQMVHRGYSIRGTVKCGEEELIFSMNKSGDFSYMRWLSPQKGAKQ